MDEVLPPETGKTLQEQVWGKSSLRCLLGIQVDVNFLQH